MIMVACPFSQILLLLEQALILNEKCQFAIFYSVHANRSSMLNE